MYRPIKWSFGILNWRCNFNAEKSTTSSIGRANGISVDAFTPFIVSVKLLHHINIPKTRPQSHFFINYYHARRYFSNRFPPGVEL